MRNPLKFPVSILFLCGMLFTYSCSPEPSNTVEEKSERTITLSFETPADGKNRNAPFDVNVGILSFTPLKVKSTAVSVATVHAANATYEGLQLNQEMARDAKVPFYIFNNATQCFIYGYIETINGQSYWTAGTAYEQVTHNICAPSGQMYCRDKKH